MRDIDAQLMMEALKEVDGVQPAAPVGAPAPPAPPTGADAAAPAPTAPTELVTHLSTLLKYFKGGTVDPAVKKILDLVIPLAVQHASKNNPQQPASGSASVPKAPAQGTRAKGVGPSYDRGYIPGQHDSL